MGAMGLPVILSVLQEDREDVELIKGALEVLHLSVLLPPQQQQVQQVQGEVGRLYHMGDSILALEY